MRTLLNIVFTLSAFFIFAAPSHATTPDPDKVINIPSICQGNDIIKANRMSGNIVRCVEHIMDENANEMIEGLVGDFSFIVFHVVVVAVMIFFIRVMFGVARARGILSLFAAKVVLVLFVANPESGEMIIKWKDALYEFPKDISFAILEAVEYPSTGSTTNLDNEDVFDRLDQYIIRMMGINESDLSDDRQEPTEMYIGVAALIAGLLFTGATGAAVSAISVGFLVAVIAAVAQLVMFFCTIVIALNFLAAIAPIAVTCILFQPTKKITSMWFQYLIIYIIQPIILMAMLGLTLGIIDNVVNNFDSPHQKVLSKWENSNQKKQHEITVFDCSGMTIPGDSLTNIFKSNNMMGEIVSQSAFADSGFDRYTSGSGSLGGDVNFSSDALNLSFGSNCEIKMPALKIDFDDTALQDASDNEVLTNDDVRQLTGLKLAVTVLMIMLISFMTKLPEMVNMMVGQGVIAELAKYASSPVKNTQETLYGKYGAGGQKTEEGIIGKAIQSTQSFQQQTVKRGAGTKTQ